MDGGMRPNFPPRFDGPPDFYRGPPGGMHYDDQFVRHRRDDRRRMSNNSQPFDEPNPEADRSERRSRWGNTSPKSEPDKPEPAEDKEQNNNSDEQQEPQQQDIKCFKSELEEVAGEATTPLHDEPEDVKPVLDSEPKPEIQTNNEELKQELNGDSTVAESN